MSEPKFTKGPWQIDENHGRDVQDSNGNEICVALAAEDLGDEWEICGSIPQPQEEAVANAHLISAAPDMYEALELIKTSSEWGMVEQEIQDAVDATISRARGEGKSA